MKKHPNRVYMTQKDHNIISGLLSRLSAAELETAERLEDELDKAEIFSSSEHIPNDVVTMHSWVHFKNLNTQHCQKIQIVYPHEANIELNKVSILSAVGSALIGLRAGDEIEWPMPSIELNTLRIEAVSQDTPNHQ